MYGENPYGIPLNINGDLYGENPSGIPFNINWNWYGEDPYGILFKIRRNWSGELLVDFPMESLRNSFQYQWKLVWRALGQFPNEILREFLSISMEICLERILMESLSKSMEIGLQSSWSISQWNPQGIPFKINGDWSAELWVSFPMDFLRNSFQL